MKKVSANLSKSFLIVTSQQTDPNKFACAVKDTGLDMSTQYYTFGTTLFFQPKSTTTRQSAGMAFFTDPTSKTGYFIRIKTSQTAGIYGDEFRIFKLKDGIVEKTFNDNVDVTKNTIAIQEGKSYKLDVFVSHSGSTVKINAFINGILVQAEDTTSVLPKTSNMSLFANLGSGYFDYAYAIKITDKQFEAPVLTDIYDSQFLKSIITLNYGEFFTNGISRIPSNTKDVYVEEFGSIAREIRYVKKRYDSAPSIPKFTFENLNTSVKVLAANLMPFEAELYVINNSGTSNLIDSSRGTQINVVGNNLIKNSGIIYQDDTINKYDAQEPIVFESQWIQNAADAEQLSRFIKTQWSKSSIILELSIFGNPLISVYDIIKIDHQFSEISPDQKFVVTSVRHSWNDGLETTITARSIVA